MIGEGEFSVLELCQKIMNKQDISKVPGLVKKINKKKYLINPPQRIHDLNILPQPARYLVDMEAYFKIGAFHSAKSKSICLSMFIASMSLLSKFMLFFTS